MNNTLTALAPAAVKTKGGTTMANLVKLAHVNTTVQGGIVMFNIDDLKAALDTGKYGEYLNDYRGSDMYICDVISEVADSETSIYYSDIELFIKEHIEELEETLDKFGWNDCGKSLMTAGQMAEYRYIENDIYDHLEDTLMLVAYDYCKHDLGMNTIPAALDETIRDLAQELTNNDLMSCIWETIDNWLAETKGA